MGILPPSPLKGYNQICAISMESYIQFRSNKKIFVFLNVCYQKIIKRQFFSKNGKSVQLQIATIRATDMLGHLCLDSNVDIISLILMMPGCDICFGETHTFSFTIYQAKGRSKHYVFIWSLPHQSQSQARVALV